MSCCAKCAAKSIPYGNSVAPDSTLGPRGHLLPGELHPQVSEGTKMRLGATGLGADAGTTNVNVGTPFWELALIGIAGIAIGAYGATMRKHSTPRSARR